MKRVKKNYMISSECIELLDYVSKTLNRRQGEVIEALIAKYASNYCLECLSRPAVVPDSVMEELQQLDYFADVAMAEEEYVEKGGND